MLSKLSLALGKDIPLYNSIILHQPTLNELTDKLTNEENILIAIKLLCDKNKDEIEDLYTSFYNISQDKKYAFQIYTLLSLLFLEDEILIDEKGIIVNNKNDYLLVSSENFHLLQTIFKDCFFYNFLFNSDSQDQEYDPANEAARLIAEKMKKNKEKINQLNNKNKKDDGTNIIFNYLTVLSVSLKMDLSLFKDKTIFQIMSVLKRNSMKINWDTDFKIRLAGGEGSKEVENWMESI